jgi:hypothetical protein
MGPKGQVYYWMKRGHATQATGKGDPDGQHKQDVIGRLSNHSPPRKVAQGAVVSWSNVVVVNLAEIMRGAEVVWS